MTSLNLNYRIEFYGGPNDGEIIFQQTFPKSTFIISNKVRNSMTDEVNVIVHAYTLSWDNPSQGRYVYSGY